MMALTSYVDPLPSPTSLTVTESLPTSISLMWEQPQGADAVDSYEISYNFTVNECSGDEDNFPPVTAIVIDGSLRSHTITNSTMTPVEEDSIYYISLTAANSVGRSEATIVEISTLQKLSLIHI